MNAAVGIRRSPPADAGTAGILAATVPLAAAGYLIFSDLRAAGAAIGALALAAWGVIAYRHPRRAILASVVLLLAAGTKFRLRDAAASLEGQVDAQILFELAAFAVIGAGALAALIASWTRARLQGVELLIAAYVPIALLSGLWSEAPTLTFVRGVQLMIIAMVAIAAVRMLGPSLALRFPCAAAGVYTMGCAALAAMFPWAAAVYESREDRFRFAWFAKHTNEDGTLAAIAARGLIAAVWWPRADASRAGRAAWPYGALACGAIGVLVLTNSRGPILAFAAALAVMAFVRLPARIRPAIAVAGSVPVLLLLTAGSDLIAWLIQLTMRDGALAQFLLQGQTAEDVLGMNGRMDLWYAVRPELAAHGVLGYGYQASRSVLLEAAYWTPAYAHNALLQSLLDLGIAGTLPLFALVGVALSSVWRSNLAPGVRGTAAAITVFLVLNSISTESFAGAPGFDVLMLCLCALAAVSSHAALPPDGRV
jgi:hypothetical protein